jgi:hypothetical protein
MSAAKSLWIPGVDVTAIAASPGLSVVERHVVALVIGVAEAAIVAQYACLVDLAGTTDPDYIVLAERVLANASSVVGQDGLPKYVDRALGVGNSGISWLRPCIGSKDGDGCKLLDCHRPFPFAVALPHHLLPPFVGMEVVVAVVVVT